MTSDSLKINYIRELEEKIKRLEANKKLLLQIIEVYDEMLKTGNFNKNQFSVEVENILR